MRQPGQAFRNHVRAAAFALASGAALVAGSGDALAQNRIKVDGSTGTAPLIEALAREFSARHPLEVEIGKGLGTKARLDALGSGNIDIAMASHGLDVAKVTAGGMTVHRIATTPVIFAVNRSVPVDGLSGAQVCAIYAGQLRDWRDAGGAALSIAPLARPETEVDMEIVRDRVDCFKGLKLAAHVSLLARAGDMAKALSEIIGAVGITSATIVARSGGKIKAVTLDGVAASEANIQNGAYKLSRDAFLIVRNSAPPEVTAFIDFVRSAHGADVVRRSGAIPAAK
jgi:phosphate transport system substrate-binding protein